MSSIEAVLRRNEAKLAITTQYYQYYQYYPIHSTFQNKQKSRAADANLKTIFLKLLKWTSQLKAVLGRIE